MDIHTNQHHYVYVNSPRLLLGPTMEALTEEVPTSSSNTSFSVSVHVSMCALAARKNSDLRFVTRLLVGAKLSKRIC